MHEVILVAKSKSLINEIQSMKIWENSLNFEIKKITDDFDGLANLLQQRKYDLLLLEYQPDLPTISLLRTIKNNNLCKYVAKISKYADFNDARKSFILGLDDYFVSPFDVNQIISLFRKIDTATLGEYAKAICQEEDLYQLFVNRDPNIKEKIQDLKYQTMLLEIDNQYYLRIKDAINNIITILFNQYPWLNHYYKQEEYLLNNINEKENDLNYILDQFYDLYKDFKEIYPKHNENLHDIIVYILNHPEEDLRQKTISEMVYMNRSYLSTLFSTQTNTSFVEYVNSVKLKRAAFLLRYTKMKVMEIANALDYKDMGYFLKRFKGVYGVTPSQFRIPVNYDFQI